MLYCNHWDVLLVLWELCLNKSCNISRLFCGFIFCVYIMYTVRENVDEMIWGELLWMMDGYKQICKYLFIFPLHNVVDKITLTCYLLITAFKGSVSECFLNTMYKLCLVPDLKPNALFQLIKKLQRSSCTWRKMARITHFDEKKHWKSKHFLSFKILPCFVSLGE